VVHSFAIAWLANGFPAALLTDNGAVFSGKSRKGKVLLESELERLGISRIHHIGLGTAYKHQRITLLVANKDIRVLADDGSLIRALTLDPSRDYQPLGTPPGPKPRPKLVNDEPET
jgi:hypothetical protein